MKLKSEEMIRNKMRARGITEEEITDFLQKARKASSEPAFVPLTEVASPGPDLLISLDHDPDRKKALSDKGIGLLEHLIVIKLNGGRSTTMGGSIPKGILEAKDGLSYLEIVCNQMIALNARYGLNLPLMLMNSFFTHVPTMEIVSRMGVEVMTLMQTQVPRLLHDSLEPLETGSDEDWVPPGHGDIYGSLKRSGRLDELLDKGYRWAFISNLDNLSACVEPWIPALMIEEQADFILEVTDRTGADRKGGTPVLGNGELQLLEIAQVGPEDRTAFQDISRFPFFNTNNLWIDLRALADVMSKGFLDLPIIQNHKIIAGRNIVQIETAMGAALGCFERSKALRVGRERFFPTKKVSDLLVLRSDACVLDSMYRLQPNSLRPESFQFMPSVFFSEDFLDSPLALHSRFENPSSLSLVQAESLDVYGSVYFESDISIKGKVEIRAGKSGMSRIPRGTFLSDCIYPSDVCLETGLAHFYGSGLYPLELSRMVVEKVWGSHSVGWGLSKELGDLPAIGELWEIFDGEDEGSVVINGPLRLTPLRELIQDLGSSLVGHALSDYIGKPFPLLIKYLFPSQVLSVQVHPDDAYALKNERSYGKTEMWIVLDSAPESYLMLGWQAELSRSQIVKGIYAEDFNSLLKVYKPQIGDVYFVPPGTPHAIGPGVTVLEIQQNSDITYRLHDWNRDGSEKSRVLHVAKALDVLDYDHIPDYGIPTLTVVHPTGECLYLCACRHFAACRWNLTAATQFVCDPERFWVLNVIGGEGAIKWPDGDPIHVETGSTILVPAGLKGFTIEPSDTLSFVKTWVPDLEKDIIEPLKKSGFSERQIFGLGGLGKGNDFKAL